MNGSYLLDTNVVIAFFGGEQTVIDHFDQADEVLLPSVVIGELDFGARKSGRTRHNLARVDDLTARVAVLDCDTDTAHHYGAIKNALRLKGRPIPDNDIWIAAVAVQYDLTLVTRDGHFAEVAGLSIETW
jgi:tRNA(fMet)-specific endonuclease VapC